MSTAFSRKLDFSDVALYAVTPPFIDRKKFLSTIDALLVGGVDAIQLRCRSLSDRELVSLGRDIKDRCHAHGALFLLNNRADIALAIDADGIHVGHQDLPIAFVRSLVGHRKIVGISTHSLPEALEAQRQGADYVSCGPLWATPTKPEYAAVGLGLMGLYNAAMRIPYVAIGGVDETNIDEVVAAGAKCVAMVRALFDAADPEKVAREFKKKISREVLCS
jgi:thiamine-phosphate pyrophosphorylase